jgi:hypothetical protein
MVTPRSAQREEDKSEKHEHLTLWHATLRSRIWPLAGGLADQTGV